MADYQSSYAGSIIDEAVSRALTLTKLDGTVLENGDETYVVVASKTGDNFSYHPLKFSQMPVQVVPKEEGSTIAFQLFTINGRGPDPNNPGAYVLNAGRIPYEKTLTDNEELVNKSVYSKLETVDKRSIKTETDLNNHIENKLALNNLNQLAQNGTNFYHIEGKVCQKWNDSINEADKHRSNSAIHLSDTDIKLLKSCQTHLNDITDTVNPFQYHLSGADRTFLTNLQSTGTNSIIAIQNNLATKIDSAFEISNKPIANQKKLWIDTEHKVLKYYDPTAKDWVTVPVAYS